MDDDKKDEIQLPEKVDSPEKLQEFVDNSKTLFNEQRDKITALENENVKLKDEIKAQESHIEIIKKDSWKDQDTQKARDYKLGKWWAQWMLGYAQVQPRPLSKTAARCVESLYSKGVKPLVQKIRYDEAREKADLGTPLTGDATGTDAQYLVPQTIYEETILRTLMAQSEIIPRLNRKTMTGRLHRYAVEGTQVSFTYVTNEVTDKTEANPTWTNVDLECETYAFWVGVTDELMEDTFADIGAQIRVQAVEALQNTIETQLLNGSGSPATGILQDTSVNESNIDSTAFDDINWDDLHLAIEDLTSRKKRDGAVFFMHPTIWDKLRTQQDANGRYFWDPATAGPRSAFGYPVLLSDNVPDLDDSATSTAFIGFGNLKYALWGVRMGLEFRYFDQTMYAVQDDENFWRVRTRQAFVVGIPANFSRLVTASS